MTFFDKSKLLKVLLLFNCVGIFLCYLFSYTIIYDNFEHIRASYFISLGYLPYKDFFEHHHPLLWFLWSPIIETLPHNAVMIFYLSKAFSLVFFCFTCLLIYKIGVNFLADKNFSLFFFLIFTSFFPVWYSASLFKPDNMAMFFYFLALYMVFRYIEFRKRIYLLSFVLFSIIAFLFLQTMAFNVFLLMLVLFALFYKDKNFWKDFLYGSSLVLCVCFLCFGWLYVNDMLLTYIQLNWCFNFKLFNFVHEYSVSVIWDWIFLIGIGVWCSFVLLKNRPNVYWKIIIFLFFCELLKWYFINAVYSHYLIFVLIFLSLLVANIVIKYNNKIGVLWVYCFLCMGINFFTLYLYNNISFMRVFL